MLYLISTVQQKKLLMEVTSDPSDLRLQAEWERRLQVDAEQLVCGHWLLVPDGMGAPVHRQAPSGSSLLVLWSTLVLNGSVSLSLSLHEVVDGSALW